MGAPPRRSVGFAVSAEGAGGRGAPPTGRIELGLSLPNTRPMRTLLHSALAMPASGRFLAVRGGEGDGEPLLCHGVPFLMRKLDIRHIPPFIRHKERVVEDRGSWRRGRRAPAVPAGAPQPAVPQPAPRPACTSIAAAYALALLTFLA